MKFIVALGFIGCLGVMAARAQLRSTDVGQQRELDEQAYELQLQRILGSRDRTPGVVHDPEEPPELDRDTAKRIHDFRKLDAAATAKFSSLLATPNTGLVRLYPDNGCVTNNIIKADEACRGFVPLSSAYSFRSGDYADLRYGDILFRGGFVVAGSFFSQGMLTLLGDVPLEKVDLSTPSVAGLMKLPVDSEFAEARKTARQLGAVLTVDGIKYGAVARAAVNQTYAVRVIAYKLANGMPTLNPRSSIAEKRFNDLFYDPRADVTAVFRIVDIAADHSITVVWKRLDRRNAPKLKFAKGEAFNDFRTQYGPQR